MQIFLSLGVKKKFVFTIGMVYKFKTIKTSVVQGMIKNWNGPSRDVLGSPSLERFKSCVDVELRGMV